MSYIFFVSLNILNNSYVWLFCYKLKKKSTLTTRKMQFRKYLNYTFKAINIKVDKNAYTW